MKDLGIEGMEEMDTYADPELADLNKMIMNGGKFLFNNLNKSIFLEDGIDDSEEALMAALDAASGVKP